MTGKQNEVCPRDEVLCMLQPAAPENVLLSERSQTQRATYKCLGQENPQRWQVGLWLPGDRSWGLWGVGADGDLVSFWGEENVLGQW